MKNWWSRPSSSNGTSNRSSADRKVLTYWSKSCWLCSLRTSGVLLVLTYDESPVLDVQMWCFASRRGDHPWLSQWILRCRRGCCGYVQYGFWGIYFSNSIWLLIQPITCLSSIKFLLLVKKCRSKIRFAWSVLICWISIMNRTSSWPKYRIIFYGGRE